MDPGLILWATLGKRQGYTLDGMPVHSHTFTNIFTLRGDLLYQTNNTNQTTGMVLGSGWKPENPGKL